MNLPNEVLLNIGQYLNLTEIYNLRQTCHEYNNIFNDYTLFANISLSGTNIKKITPQLIKLVEFENTDALFIAGVLNFQQQNYIESAKCFSKYFINGGISYLSYDIVFIGAGYIENFWVIIYLHLNNCVHLRIITYPDYDSSIEQYDMVKFLNGRTLNDMLNESILLVHEDILVSLTGQNMPLKFAYADISNCVSMRANMPFEHALDFWNYTIPYQIRNGEYNPFNLDY